MSIVMENLVQKLEDAIEEIENRIKMAPRAIEIGYLTYADLMAHPNVKQHLKYEPNQMLPSTIMGLRIIKVNVPTHFKVI
jgi:hypothetical protein